MKSWLNHFKRLAADSTAETACGGYRYPFLESEQRCQNRVDSAHSWRHFRIQFLSRCNKARLISRLSTTDSECGFHAAPSSR
ncbi:hypothetical protein CEXT_323721 [Caerostris extrusa]|uniref:Uncharacterized protein n=1 Tax=Caerostris extrusa TaxID=172846 RepID=A0AAV4XLF1_CAEEX|nr:hypothetical protein CEXT_323721 [Caerostris extrusa]